MRILANVFKTVALPSLWETDSFYLSRHYKTYKPKFNCIYNKIFNVAFHFILRGAFQQG